jgi:Fur family zinc uptake transcriptional regulator
MAEAAALERAEEACRRRGVQLTELRRQVLELVLLAGQPIGAYALLDRLRAARPGAAPPTVYRALDFLMEQGLVHRLASRNAYVACPKAHEGGEAVAFLICETCGGVDELTSPELSSTLQGLLGKEGFAPNGKVLEITGHCSHCH